VIIVMALFHYCARDRWDVDPSSTELRFLGGKTESGGSFRFLGGSNVLKGSSIFCKCKTASSTSLIVFGDFTRGRLKAGSLKSFGSRNKQNNRTSFFLTGLSMGCLISLDAIFASFSFRVPMTQDFIIPVRKIMESHDQKHLK